MKIGLKQYGTSRFNVALFGTKATKRTVANWTGVVHVLVVDQDLLKGKGAERNATTQVCSAGIA